MCNVACLMLDVAVDPASHLPIVYVGRYCRSLSVIDRHRKFATHLRHKWAYPNEAWTDG